jgi:hypothetical protein
MSETTMHDSKSHNKRYNQTNQKAWLIWYDDGWSSDYGDFMIFLDQSDAIEMHMALSEEELYMIFAWMTQDEYETMSLEEMAIYVKLTSDVGWRIMEVPLYGTICC